LKTVEKGRELFHKRRKKEGGVLEKIGGGEALKVEAVDVVKTPENKGRRKGEEYEDITGKSRQEAKNKKR